MIIGITELNENEVKALEFVAEEEQRIEKIMELDKELRELDEKLHKLGAYLEYGAYGEWYRVNNIEPVNTRFSGRVRELRIGYNPKTFTI